MHKKPPSPLCKAFLVCREIHEDRRFGDFILVGQSKAYCNRVFPAAINTGFFARLTSAHGEYQIEVQLHDQNGDVVWREGPPQPWPFPSPLGMYDLTLHLCPVFPGPGSYDFVLLANGEELARQRFEVRLTPQPTPP